MNRCQVGSFQTAAVKSTNIYDISHVERYWFAGSSFGNKYGFRKKFKMATGRQVENRFADENEILYRLD